MAFSAVGLLVTTPSQPCRSRGRSLPKNQIEPRWGDRERMRVVTQPARHSGQGMAGIKYHGRETSI